MTTDVSQRHVCLGIPLPKCMCDVIVTCPEPCLSTNDPLVHSIIERFGRNHHLANAEIEKCWQLASGGDDVVILLERPANNHDYNSTFANFVSASPVLKAVGELIETASGGSRNINNVCIIDAFCFKPKRPETLEQDFSNSDCFDLAEQIIRLRKPRAVLGCCSGIDQGHWLAKFNAGRVGQRPQHHSVNIEGNVCRVLPSFHPSHCINYVQWHSKSRILLIYHFILLISLSQGRPDLMHLGGSIVPFIPESSSDAPSMDQVRTRVLMSLRKVHRKDSRTVSRSVHGELALSMLNEIDDMLWTISLSNGVRNGSDIACIAVLWQEYFKAHPLFELFLTKILAVGVRQSHFVNAEEELTNRLERLNFRTKVMVEEVQFSEFDHISHEKLFNHMKQCFATLHWNQCRTLSQQAKILKEQGPAMYKVSPDLKQYCAQVQRHLQDYVSYAEEFVAFIASIPTIFYGGQGVIEGKDHFPALIQSRNAKRLLQQLLEEAFAALNHMKESRHLKDDLIDFCRREILQKIDYLHFDDQEDTVPALETMLETINETSAETRAEALEALQVLIAVRTEMAGVSGLLYQEQPYFGSITRKSDASSLLTGVWPKILEDITAAGKGDPNHQDSANREAD